MKKRKKVFITAAITGAVHVPSMSPYLPVTPQQIIDDAVRAYEAGASNCHLHTRNPETGAPDASIDLMREVVAGIQHRCDMICCVTTGASQMMTLEERLAPIPALQPELATCNAGSMNFVLADIAEKIPDGYGWEKPYLIGTKNNTFSNTYIGLETFIRTMNANGTRPEFEVYDPGMINNIAYFVKKGLVKTPAYIQFVMGIQGGIPASVKNLLFLKETADLLLGEGQYVWSAAAAGRYQMPIAAAALSMGGNVRVGLEDNLYLRPHVLAQSSADQVSAVRGITDALGIDIASAAEVREMMCLKGAPQMLF